MLPALALLRNAQAAVIAGVFVALAGVTFEAVRSIDHEYASEVAEVVSYSDRTAQKLADQTTQVFDRVNQATLLVKYLHDTHALPPLVSMREAGVISDELVEFVYVADHHGFVVDTTAGLSAANVADEDFFKRHRLDASLDVDIAPAWINPITSQYGIPVTRRLSRGPAFDGLVTATLNPELAPQN